MSDRFKPAVISAVEVETVPTEFEKIELGQWFWYEESSGPILMCVMEIGTNYIELREPEGKGGYRSCRVHRNQLTETLTYEPDADAKIREMVEQYQTQLSDNMAKIQRLTSELGIAPQIANQSKLDSEGKSLALLSGQVDVDAFKNALILAQKETLPALFENNEEITKELARWLGASSMPMKAKLGPMKTSVDAIEDRLFNIQLYSGMLEDIVTVAEGEPAGRDEKLRIFQRRLYCDEESLLDYASGGMEFKTMADFDRWLAKPVNRDRIFPFPRCMVSMRVRRHVKDRAGTGLSAFIEFQEKLADQYTYLYVRNGEQLYRVCTDLDFGEMMFPDRAIYDPSEPMMMRVFVKRVKQMMPKREYDSLVNEQRRRKAENARWTAENPKQEWEKANPGKSWYTAVPYYSVGSISESEWHLFDDSSVYYDEGMKLIQSEIKEYNRIALVVQGLFDRTTALHPHNPAQMWRPESFSTAVELIYDNSNVLHYGDAPDIEAYIAACNAQTTADSVMYGQELVWMEKEAERENRRQDNDWRTPSDRKYHYRRLKPEGDPGPGRLAKMSAWKPRSKVATFTWRRERRTHSFDEPFVKAKVTAPIDRLFNVSAYKPGDFAQFFKDPRTREQYLQWAPMLLSAEDYHNGVLRPKEPVRD